jgi:hypothetical protein
MPTDCCHAVAVFPKRCANVPNPVVSIPQITRQPGTNAPCFQNLNYASNEACTIEVGTSVTLNVLNFSTEANYDFLYVNGERYSGTVGPNNVAVVSGSKIYWKSDGAIFLWILTVFTCACESLPRSSCSHAFPHRRICHFGWVSHLCAACV